MAHYDRIFNRATIVNQDGIHEADIGVAAGRVAALGTLTADTAAVFTSSPASSIRRCISVSPGSSTRRTSPPARLQR